eukprot:718118-Amphidinium_carterae.1
MEVNARSLADKVCSGTKCIERHVRVHTYGPFHDGVVTSAFEKSAHRHGVGDVLDSSGPNLGLHA